MNIQIFNRKIFDQNYFILESLDDLANYYSFRSDFEMIEDDLGQIRFVEDINDRRSLDAKVLSMVAANCPKGRMLDIGTHRGRSAARMAVNNPDSTIYTVNIHPEEFKEAGNNTTECLSVEEIGSYYKEREIQNITQIYANTKKWEIPDEIRNLSLVYIDGCHDKEFVFSDTKSIFDRISRGGFILWHDFSPIYRNNFSWINESMSGVEKLLSTNIVSGPIFNVRNSWIGIWRKN